jgi:hypothetical protein
MKAVSVFLSILTSLALVSANPTKRAVDHAAGVFEYTTTSPSGERQVGHLKDPRTEKCIGIHGTRDEPADSPMNDTDEKVILFSQEDCDGGVAELEAGDKLDHELKFRSVKFKETALQFKMR